MAIKIVTDSTCDLPADVVAEYGIRVVPLYINMDGESYLDGVELSRQEFYERLPGCATPPQTAMPGVDHFVQAYRELAEQGASEILSIHISPTLSSVYAVARVAASQFSSVPVSVLDSRNLSLGVGFTVLAAARAAAEGRSLAEILVLLEDLVRRTHVFAMVDTMEYLRRSGRVNGLISNIGNLLHIKPLLKMNDGVAASERVRTEQRAFRRLIHLVSELGHVERLALVHTNAADKAQALWQQAQSLFPHIKDPWSVDVTSVLGVHLGPGAVGFACVAASRG